MKNIVVYTYILCGDTIIDISPENSRSNDYLNILSSHGLLPAHNLATNRHTCFDYMMVKSKLDAICLVIESPITDQECVAFSLRGWIQKFVA